MLLIFGGLPASGKSTISTFVARELGAAYISVDTIEQSLKNTGMEIIYSEGYELAYDLAADNLRLGLTVVADSVNAIEITRAAWRAVGRAAAVRMLEIEITCSDSVEHKRRLENRATGSGILEQPNWNDVLARDYENWARANTLIDTAGESPEQSMAKALSHIKSSLFV